ncbi:HlyD family secretion protein [Actibacterium lipolyticum]|uniref:Putative efflux pump membrane fusion protein n=1 Tax=Actibacterium lipolyticum TaxID=1524263 RepID=A0A238JY34_9RHOB|nr:HlyD family efflux transporter periplasmic adaptor subunit [Actibacterium lipolyticum]SMX34752.1 putative efflux pump membrane fusion protein [Actibacterium lipolyticum]
MPSRDAAIKSEGVKQKTYRITAKVTVSNRGGSDTENAVAFVKHTESGRLFRLGKEEYFLLSQLDAGQTPDEVAADFHAEFGKIVRADIVERFARQMLGAGILQEIDEVVVERIKVDDAVEVADTAEVVDEASDEDELDPENGDDDVDDEPEDNGGRDYDEMRDLEDLVFNDDAGPKDAPSNNETSKVRRLNAAIGAANRKAQQKSTEGTSQKDEPSDQTQSAANTGPGEASPKVEAAPIADPEVANRKVKFQRDAGVDGKTSPPGMLRLFDPTGMLRVLSDTFGWWRHISWLLYPLVIFAMLVVFNRLAEFGLGMAMTSRTVSRIAFIVVSLFTVNLFTRLVTAVVAHRKGAEVRHFGLTFILFFFPRFAIDLSGVQKLDREGKLAVYSSTMKARLFLFATATIIWAATRRSATVIPDLAMIVEQISFLTFLLTAFPLLQGDGYKWISTYFNQPFLRQRSYYYVFGTSKKIAQHLPDPTKGEKWAFALYAIGSALVSGLLISLLVIYVSTGLEGRFGGTGLVMFFGLLVLIAVWLSVMKSGQQEARKKAMKSAMADRMAERKAEGGQGAGMGMGAGGGMGMGLGGGNPGRALVPVASAASQGTALAKRKLTDVGRPRPAVKPLAGIYADNAASQRRSRWVTRLFMVVALTGLAYVALRPYSYEVGGDFAILPDMRTEVNARVAGELVEIFVDEGDVVQEGDLVARLSDWQPKRQVASAKAELAKAEARLQKLQDGATEEEIQVAREQVGRAEASIPFLKSQAERAETLLERKTISDADAERYQSQYITGLQDLRSAEANLAKVVAPATETDIIIAEAEVEKLRSELDFHIGALNSVEIEAPVAGRVVSENVSLMRGKFLDAGELFIEIENHEVARAEVKISETDIGLVQIGDTVRLKAWASSNGERDGTVISIAPVAETEEFGRVLRVKTQFNNEEGFFRPGMTGFAKIEGGDMKVWQAFTRLFDRFFRIEVWGWIP